MSELLESSMIPSNGALPNNKVSSGAGHHLLLKERHSPARLRGRHRGQYPNNGHKETTPAGVAGAPSSSAIKMAGLSSGQKKGRVGSPLGNGSGGVVDVPGPGERLYLQLRRTLCIFAGSAWLLSYMTSSICCYTLGNINASCGRIEPCMISLIGRVQLPGPRTAPMASIDT